VPDVPSAAESGLPGFEAMQWFGILAPAGVSKDVIVKLHADIVKAVRLPDVRDRMMSLGAEVVGSTPSEFAAFQKADTVKWAKVVKASGAKID